MGDVIYLAARRAQRDAVRDLTPPVARRGASFFFDVASPWTYLAAERVDRLFGDVRWRPVQAEGLPGLSAAYGAVASAERRAAQLRVPLVWPERWPAAVPVAMRVAALAAEVGRGAPFVLAAGRLAFCGGYDLEDPEILAEAAAAAGLGLDDALRAARDPARDAALEQRALRLVERGADALPAIAVGRRLYCGEWRLAAAATASAAGVGAVGS